jgi:hypothetical protein
MVKQIWLYAEMADHNWFDPGLQNLTAGLSELLIVVRDY